jgi:tetratricopeptide (TPR) repeat protein
MTDAEASARTLVERLGPLVAAEPENPRLRQDMAHAHRMLAVVHRHLGKLPECRDDWTATLLHAEKALLLQPDAASAIVLAHESRFHLASVCEQIDGPPGASLEALRAAIEAAQGLRDRYPNEPLSHIRLASYWGCLAGKYQALGRYDEADAAFVKAVACDDHLATRFPNEPPNIREYSWNLRGSRGLLLIGRGNADAGVPLLRHAVRDLERAVGQYPSLAGVRAQLLAATTSLALSERQFGTPDAAAAAFRRYAELLAKLDPGTHPYEFACGWVFLPDELRTTALGAAVVRDHGAALPAWLRAAVWHRLGRFADSLTATDGDPSLHAQFLRALCLSRLGRPAESREVFADAAWQLADAPFCEPEVAALYREAAACLAGR